MSVEFAKKQIEQVEGAKDDPGVAMAILDDLASRMTDWSLLYALVKGDRPELLYHPSNAQLRVDMLLRMTQLMASHEDPPFVSAMQLLMVCHREPSWARVILNSQSIHAWVYLGLLLCQQSSKNRGANSATVVSLFHNLLGRPGADTAPYTEPWTKWVCQQFFGDIWMDFHCTEAEQFDIRLIVIDVPPLSPWLTRGRAIETSLALPGFI